MQDVEYRRGSTASLCSLDRVVRTGALAHGVETSSRFTAIKVKSPSWEVYCGAEE